MSGNKSYMDNPITWQAYTYMKVTQETIETGQYPNGQKMKAKDYDEAHEQIENCKSILAQYGIVAEVAEKGQLKLF